MAARDATSADVALAAPELAALADFDALVAFYLPLAVRRVGLAAYGDDTSDAQALLTAHWISTSPSGGGDPGVVTSETDGPSSRSFAVPPVEDDLDASSYGSVFQALRRIARVGRGIVGNTCYRR